MIDIYNLPTKENLKKNGIAELELSIRMIAKETPNLNQRICETEREMNQKIPYSYSEGYPSTERMRQLKGKEYTSYMKLLRTQKQCLKQLEVWAKYKPWAVTNIQESKLKLKKMHGLIRESNYGQYTCVSEELFNRNNKFLHLHGICL